MPTQATVKSRASGLVHDLALGIGILVLCLGLVEGVYSFLLTKPVSHYRRDYKWIPPTPRQLAGIHERAGFEIPTHFDQVRPVRSASYAWPSTDGLSLDYAKRFDPGMFRPPSRFHGHGYAPGVWRSKVQTSKGDTLFDIQVRIDSLGRRETPNPDPERRTRYLINLGASVQEGLGRTDAETFSGQLAQLAPDYHVYNYGKAGNGPFEVLSLLQDMSPRREVSEEDGVATYLYGEDHIRRMRASVSYYLDNTFITGSGWGGPYYEVSGDRVQRYDSYESAHPILGLFYAMLSQSRVLAYYHMNFPWWLGFEDLRRAARLFREMRDVYARKFGNDRFYVILYPEHTQTALPRLLEAEGVKFLNYERFDLGLYTHGPPWIHALDSHPSAEAVSLVSKVIADDLGLAPRQSRALSSLDQGIDKRSERLDRTHDPKENCHQEQKCE